VFAGKVGDAYAAGREHFGEGLPMIARLGLSRRALLSGAVAGLALPWVRRVAYSSPTPAIGDQAWRMLAERITGGVMRPPDPRFLLLTRPENLRYYNPPSTPDGPADPDAPFAVVRPRDAGEVAAAILWAQEFGCRMVPRSGGHSYAGCSTVPGLVIHAGAMRQVRYDSRSGLLELGGGVLNGDIFDALRHSRHTIVHGRCRTVGLSSFLMGGGLGLAMREHGVGCDLVEGVELVLADGRIVRPSATNAYSELFWAVRGGGGGNLGFATRWWLRPVPADKVVSFLANWWPDANTAVGIFKRLVRTLEESPEQMGAQMSISVTAANQTKPNQISLIGEFRGPPARFAAILGGALADARQKTVLELPYWEAQEFCEIETVPNCYQETSLFAEELSDAVIDAILQLSRTLPSPAADARLTLFLTGGRINTVRPDATAFVHRSSRWLINTILGWKERDDPTDYLKWQRNVHDTLRSLVSGGGSYQNFSDPGLDDHAGAYWGADLARLSKVKAEFDPHAVFTPPRDQEIPQP
jgi:FAD/FMN-containing dehydrogenase